ncbi:spore coat protein E [Halolactibacillus alkaliphilus]|uniref:Spore coat protein E n=1 Tax=Halolactibacillus alkaliphilus TaxID=442899 RepID=A0A511X4K3_9BACI|nr:outer spore coat protein CotE [Halolactibacillus alkaliphilus]GEN57873.1 spore coat protein E [Halolactibacillus alkaliphilus]GGN73550.1 spore coat protein E [Halolactibacillus alkaliphilus]SFO96953.1 spore coat protein E [Halolactibacillus alkaliphilus]
MSYLEKDVREIITKAVIGKGEKVSTSKHVIKPAHRPDNILGCWIINHVYHAKQRKVDAVDVNGEFDINVWYAFNDSTKTEVVTEHISYQDPVELSVTDKHTLNKEADVYAKMLKQPHSVECKISEGDGTIRAEVEKSYLVEVIGDTKVSVKVDPGSIDDEHFHWYNQKDE